MIMDPELLAQSEDFNLPDAGTVAGIPAARLGVIAGCLALIATAVLVCLFGE